MEIYPILRECKVFADFNDSAIARLAISTRTRDYSTGEFIVRFGQKVGEVGVVASGTVEARYRTSGRVVVIEPGQIYGEVALLNGEPAIADVVATSAARVLLVPFNALTAELSRTPAAAGRLASLVVRRLARREEDPNEQADAMGARHEARTRTDEPVPLDGRPVLVLNCGSSSVKYACFVQGERRVSGIVERIGASGSCLKHDGPHGRVVRDRDVPDADTALRLVLQILTDPDHGAVERLEDIAAVGHRTVHGGDRFTESILVDEDVKAEMRRNEVLAPLHNPANLKGIEVCERLLPGVPQVAVFDTAFHLTMPEHAWRYAIPREVADRWRLRRYGFHGTSHKYVTRATGRFLGTAASGLRIVSCHLGNGASMTAVDHGRSVDTSMGLTPLEGLVMGTRSGDVDPGLVLHLLGQGMTREAVDDLLNRQSGLLGLSRLSSDMRELEAAADAGHAGAILAIQAFCYRIRKYIGAYAAVMGGLDVLVFTGGIGENDAAIRARVCQGLGFLGVRIDETRNARRATGLALEISPDDAPVRVLVVPTDEEGSIVVETDHALDRAGTTEAMRNRRDRPIPIGVSAHHVHLSQEHVEALFGPGRTLTVRSPLTQPGQFACEETVDLVGPKGRVERVRVLGPVRRRTQVEISRTEEYRLGVDAPVRQSGDVRGTPGLTIEGPAGSVHLDEGVICAMRHIHMSPEDALGYGLRDGDEIRVRVDGTSHLRSLVFGDVVVRVHPEYRLEMHLDTDEANAAEITAGTTGVIDSIQHRKG